MFGISIMKPSSKDNGSGLFSTLPAFIIFFFVQAAKLVNDAHRIARERGRNVISIMKDLVEDLKKK